MAWNRVSGRKYNNKKITYREMEFDSKKELKRYKELEQDLSLGIIRWLDRQVKFELIPAQYEESGEVYTKGPRAGEPKQGRLMERACYYVADFMYINDKGEKVVEDVKSPVTRTKDYIIKRKLMLYRYGIQIREV